jgi:uncharacterized membrane protein
MPFCSQCGNQVNDRDLFCRRCGAQQPIEGLGAARGPHQGRLTAQDILYGIQPRTASIMCYIPGIGWIASIIVLAADRFRRNRVVRFHGFQGLYLFVAWLVNDIVVKPMFWGLGSGLHIYELVRVVLLVMSVFMMVKASQDEMFSLPLFGELAQRSMTEGV